MPISYNWPDVTGTEEGLVKGKALKKRGNLRESFWAQVKSSVTVIQVDGDLPKEQIREDAKPLEELTFTSALPFFMRSGKFFRNTLVIGTLVGSGTRVPRVSTLID